MEPRYLTVGKIVNTHGIKGELKVLSQTDFPDIRFAKGSELLLVLAGQSKPLALTIESSRLHKNVYIVKFKGLDDINAAEKYKDGLLKVSEEELIDLPEDEYYYHEIMGCQVVTDEGEELGTITEILAPGANDVWVVSPPKGKPILIPVIDDVLLDVDVKGKVVKIHLLEGLR
jgi:16S rRNA processing protein RimM